MDSGSESDRDDPGSSAAILPYLYVGDAAFACNTAAWKELGCVIPVVWGTSYMG